VAQSDVGMVHFEGNVVQLEVWVAQIEVKMASVRNQGGSRPIRVAQSKVRVV
jgi:hypothetical protein